MQLNKSETYCTVIIVCPALVLHTASALAYTTCFTSSSKGDITYLRIKLKTFKMNFQLSHQQPNTAKPDIHAYVYMQCIMRYAPLSVTTMSGLQVPKSTVCLFYLNIPRLSEN